MFALSIGDVRVAARRGDYFISNAVLLGPKGAEVLTRTPIGPLVR
jgi:hypothetical protein